MSLSLRFWSLPILWEELEADELEDERPEEEGSADE